jgi:alanine racemase
MRGRPTIAWIDAEALRSNFARIRASVPPAVAILAVVKADAYGHGASLVAPLLAAAGADLFGVATLEEGVELREAGIVQPIVVLAGAARDEAAEAAARGLGVAVFDARLARDLAVALGERELAVHVKLDTGMTRLGAMPEDLPALIGALRDCPRLRVEGVFSHFGDADSVGTPFADRQIRAFRDGVGMLRAAGFAPRWVHLANSVATLTRPESFGNLVRPGIILYGVPPAAAEPGGWRQVMHLRTRVWQVKSVPAGCPVSYGQTFVTRRPSRIAVLPVGYADGYDRRLSNRGQVLIHEQRAPIVGRVCMDFAMADVTDVPQADAGDEVVLWGDQGSANLSVTEVAEWQGSIAYEVLTRVGKRVPRILMESV